MLSELFEQFLRERKYLKNVTPKTINYYHNCWDSLVSLLLDTGIRKDEALTLKPESIDLDNMLLTVKGKGKNERSLMHFAAWSLMPYLIYRVYAVWWGYALWKANS